MPLRFRVWLPLALFLAGAVVLVERPVTAQVQLGNQWPVPRLNFLFPFGARPGATLEVTFGGTDTEQPESLWFSHPGIKGTAIVPEVKVDPKADPKKAPLAPPAITKFNITVDKDVPPGSYDVRLVNAKGVSNPRVFVVGDLNEELEKEPNNDVEQAQKVAIGTTISGVIAAPTDVDYYQVTAKAGQRFLFHVACASVDSKLSPEMRIFDKNNRQLIYSRGLPNQDDVLDFTAPADGDYLLRLNQFTYTAGGTDYFYRLNVSAGPWIDSVHPPMVMPGKATQVTIHGRNLPGGKKDPSAVQEGVVLEKLTVTVNAPADSSRLDFFGNITPWQGTLNGFEYRLGNSNPKFISFAQAPVILETEGNDTPEKAQQLQVPCEIAGRIDQLRDRDWYVFDAKKGDVFMIEAFSHRIGAPTDLYLKLVNVAKKQDITLQDDNPEAVSARGYYTPTRDPAPYRFVVPEDGKYQILIGSHLGDIAAGPVHQYRVRITPEQPNFNLIALPAEEYRQDSSHLGRGGAHYFNVFAVRQDGFKGEIALDVEGLPKGVKYVPQVISPASKFAYVVLQAGDDAPEKFNGLVKVVGTSVINGKKVVREARAASVTWGSNNAQQQAPSVTRHVRGGHMLAIRSKAPVRMTAEKDRIIVLVGDKAEIPMKLARIDTEFKGNFQIQPIATDLPPGVTFAALTFAPGKDDQKLALTTQATTPPGTYSIVFRGFAPIAPPNTKGKGVNTVVPSSPPVTLTVVPKQVATLTVDNANLPLLAGKEAVVTVKVARLADYAETFKVDLLADNTNGVTAESLVIPAGQNEVKVKLKAPANAAPGARTNLTLRAVAVLHGLTLNHDVKFNVKVVPPQLGVLSVDNGNPPVLAGKDAVVVLKVARQAGYKDAFKVQLLPDNANGLTVDPLTIPAGQSEVKVTLKAPANAAPGPRTNLTLRAAGVMEGLTLNHDVKLNATVVPPQVGKFVIDNGNPPLIVGKEAVVTLKVDRQSGYQDAFKVQLLPENANGVTAEPLTIAAGQNEAKVTLKVPANAAAGQRNNLTLRAVAVVSGLTLNHDLKLNVNVMPESKK